jgi:antitoxin ParD1/3/4
MAQVEKLTIALTPEMAGSVRHAVHSGEYASASEVISEAVREWQERRSLLGFTVDGLRALAEEGRDSGPAALTSIDEIKTEARRRFAAKPPRA